MGGISTDQGDSLNVELNLVPFIDLLSTLVLFLLITAVWIQISAVPASVETAGKKSAAPPPPVDRLTVHLSAGGQTLTWPPAIPSAKLPKMIPANQKRYNFDMLTNILKSVTEAYPIANAGVSADDLVDYGAVVETIDAIKAAGVPLVAISTN